MIYRKATLLLFLFFLVLGVNGQGIEFFHGNWKDAMAKAKAEDKLLFVDAYAKWCGPCKKMAKDEFTKVEVGDVFNENFINIKLDMEEMDGVSFGHKYPVKAYPTMLFLDGDGKVVYKVKGGRDGKGLIKMAEIALKSFDRSGQYVEAYEKGDRSFELVYKYINALNQAGKPSLQVANDFLSTNPELSDEEVLQFLSVAAVEADSKIFEMVLDRKSEMKEYLGEEEYEELIINACMATVNKSIEFETDFLLDEAKMQATKALDKKTTERFSMDADLYYAKAYGNEAMVLEIAEKYAKKYGKEDANIYRTMIQAIDTCKDKIKVEKLQKKLGEELYSRSKEDSDIMFYCNLLIQMQEYDKAIKVAEKAVKNAEKEGRDGMGFQRLISMAKALKA